jgi:hypothetical protein
MCGIRNAPWLAHIINEAVYNTPAAFRGTWAKLLSYAYAKNASSLDRHLHPGSLGKWIILKVYFENNLLTITQTSNAAVP